MIFKSLHWVFQNFYNKTQGGIDGIKSIISNLHENHQKMTILIKQSTDFISYFNTVTRKIMFPFLYKFPFPNLLESY